MPGMKEAGALPTGSPKTSTATTSPIARRWQQLSSSVVACGLASVPVDIVVYLHLDHPRPNLVIELEDPNGQVDCASNQAWSPGPIIAQVGSGDDEVNGRWTLRVRGAVSGVSGTLTGWSLYLLSRWD